MRSARVCLLVAAVLLALLALARGAGGVVLLLQGGAAVPDARASAGEVVAIGCGLLVVTALGLAAAWQLARRRPRSPRLAFAALAAFVIGGLINGALLFGRPTDRGTIANLIAAAIIGAIVWAGKAAARRDDPA